MATGEGMSPAISWANVPAGTQSFFLNMHDMDVARNKTTDDQAHWVVWNIPATATGLPEGVPKGPKLANGAIRSARPARCIAVLAPAQRSEASLHVRALRARHEARRAARRRRVRDRART